jgi:hypothetical protein
MFPSRGSRSPATLPVLPPRSWRAVVVALAIVSLDQPAPARAEGASRTWVLSGTLRQIHTSNLFPFFADGPGDVIASPSVSLSYQRTVARTSLAVSASAYALRYSEQTQYNRAGGAFSIGGSHRFSERARMGLSLGVNSGLATENIYTSRTLFPQIDVSGQRGATHLSYDVSRTTVVTMDVGGYESHFSTSIPILGLSVDPSVPPAFFPGLTEAVAGPLGPLVQIDPAVFALGIIGSEGLAAGESDISLFGGGFGLTHAFSPVLSATAWAGYSRLHLSTSPRQEGGRVDLRGSLSRQFTPSTRVSLTYVNERNRAQVPEVTNQTFVVEAAKSFNENVEFAASLGYGVLATPVSSFGGTVLGGVGLTSHRGSNTLRMRLDRTTYQAFGVGRNQVSDVGYVHLGRTLSKRLTTWLDGRVRSSRDPFEDRFSVTLHSYGTGLSYRFHERTQLGTDYNFQRYTPLGALDSIDSSIWSFYVSYGKAFR